MTLDDITIPAVLEKYGIKGGLGKQTQKRIPCPLHSGDHDNFSYTDKLYQCFKCGSRGNAIRLVAELFGIKYWQAVERVKTDFGLKGTISLTSYREQLQIREKIKERQRNERYIDYMRFIFTKHRRLMFWHYGEDNMQVKYLDRILDRLTDDPESFLAWEIDIENLIENIWMIAEKTNWYEVGAEWKDYKYPNVY